MNYDTSRAWYERACRVIPGGVNSNVRLNSEPLPLFYSHGRDGRIWDIDGNEYIDYVLGQGPMLLGHTPRPVIEAIQRQAEKGLVYAGQSELEVRAAELIVEHVPCAEMVRFNTTGSEAVHAAVRLARAATDRTKVLRFEGHYHGWLDTIAWCPARRGDELGTREAPLMRASSKGQPSEDAVNLLVLPWNDEALLGALFTERGTELAAVICDPFACAAGLIPARPAFLRALRTLCDAHGVVLIFDEVITGFRVTVGGAQAYYGVTPDLATFAKALGGGLAVAAVAGKAELMRLFGEGPTVHAGTYNANPLAMAGTVAALELLTANGGSELQKAHVMGKRLWEGLASAARQAGHTVDFRGVPPVFSISFLPEAATPILDFRSALQADADKLKNFWRAMHQRGVQFTSFGIWFLSTAHTEADIDQTIAAAAASFEALGGTFSEI
ncbi:MAG: aspartate aminotransferase family protein [Candidatus Hydrogenedentes bacterium]|nr:aspartate aminotransferase family protein [Candidatus Hydrogenedentota bacterium]